MAQETGCAPRRATIFRRRCSGGECQYGAGFAVVSIERGYDPREFALVAFGGAGGLHACELAEALAIPTVMIPARPGALSAYGILISDVVKDYSHTLLWRLAGRGSQAVTGTRLDNEFRKLEASAQAESRVERWRDVLHYERSIDLRYRGQAYELNLPATTNVIAHFEKEHQRRYGYCHAGRDIELVTLRLARSFAYPAAHPIRTEKYSSACWCGGAITCAAPRRRTGILSR